MALADCCPIKCGYRSWSSWLPLLYNLRTNCPQLGDDIERQADTLRWTDKWKAYTKYNRLSQTTHP
jgi:hypothetical protein